MPSSTMTDQQALALAKGFRAASGAVGDALYQHWDALPAQERASLQTLEIALLNIASDLSTQAVGLILDDSRASLVALNAVTADARAVLARLDDVAQLFTIATGLVALASAIPAGHVDDIVLSLEKLRTSLAQASAAEPAPLPAPLPAPHVTPPQ